ncbi:hypothetical protein ANO14919_126860 [Xylariales sp. No.14919]|nr:hypothetical protein ANO14919_126860 [Xylariales sp. No.14919]
MAGLLCDRPLATLSLEDLDLQTLVMLLHTKHSSTMIDLLGPRDPNRIFAELVALPLHDAWAPLAEFYTSVARFEDFMSHGQATAPQMLTDRWPLAFALMMGTGKVKSEYAVSSPIASEAFKFAQAEKNWGGRIKVKKPLRIRGFDPVLPSEHTLVLLREPNLGRLRYGMVTRDDAGRLEVHDPAAVARTAGDEEAAGRLGARLRALPAWRADKKAETKERNTTLLDTAAVETMYTASTELAARAEEIQDEIEEMRKGRERA